MPVQRWRGIADDLRARIERGEWTSGDLLPPHRDLMRYYRTTSQATIARAIAALVSEGMLVSDPAAPRRGVRVRSRHLVQRDLVAGLRLEYQRAMSGEEGGEVGLFEAMTGIGGLDVQISYELIAADVHVARSLDVVEGTPLLVRTFCYTIEGTPHQVVRSHMTADVAHAAGLTAVTCERPGRGTIAQLRDADIHVDRVKIEMEARVPTTTEVNELAILAGVPVFAHRRVMYAAHHPVEMSMAVVAGDRVSYIVNVDLNDLTNEGLS
ncbi:MAG: GntR family transcriptional regulator [Pseudonocardiaceae bacterium]